MSGITKLEMQPFFPLGDLTPANADVLKYVLPREAGVYEQARFLGREQIGLLHACHNALIFNGLPSDENPKTLQAIAVGFAGYETITSLVTHPKAYDTARAIGHADRTFAGDTIGRGIRRSIRTLIDQQPITLDVVQSLGSEDATSEEITSLMAGAAVARQLQLPPIQLTLVQDS